MCNLANANLRVMNNCLQLNMTAQSADFSPIKSDNCIEAENVAISIDDNLLLWHQEELNTKLCKLHAWSLKEKKHTGSITLFDVKTIFQKIATNSVYEKILGRKRNSPNDKFFTCDDYLSPRRIIPFTIFSKKTINGFLSLIQKTNSLVIFSDDLKKIIRTIPLIQKGEFLDAIIDQNGNIYAIYQPEQNIPVLCVANWDFYTGSKVREKCLRTRNMSGALYNVDGRVLWVFESGIFLVAKDFTDLNQPKFAWKIYNSDKFKIMTSYIIK